jgi:sugar lactone lactonase YvrE
MTAEIVQEDAGATVLCETRCHLGEGPAYDPVHDTAWWFDILGRHLYEADLGAGTVRSHELPVMASVLAWIARDRQMVATEDGIYARDVRDGRLSLLLPLEADNPVTRSNDGRVHPSGALWIGTMGKSAEPEAGAIYHVLDGEITRLYANMTVPNAICFSPDGRTAYFTDTPSRLLHRVAVDPRTGRPTRAPEALYDHRGGMGAMDGAVTDAEGLIWNARWGAGCVDVYSPEGQRIRSLRVPATRASCPVFVGPGFDRLLVTSAYQGMNEAELAADPHHGRTFLLDPCAEGKPEPRARVVRG